MPAQLCAEVNVAFFPVKHEFVSPPPLPARCPARTASRVSHKMAPKIIPVATPPPPKKAPPSKASILKAIETKAYPLEDNAQDPLANSTVSLFADPLRAATTLAILPLAMIRIGVFLVVFVSSGLCASAASCCPHRSPPRRAFLWASMRLVRAGLFCLGFHRVEERGAPAPRDAAPILASNHTSFVEAFYLTQRFRASGMAAEDLAAIPMVGNVLRALEFVLVDKADDASRRRAAEDLKKSLGDPRAPRFLVFPEGQTNNGSRLIGFKDGAFRLGHGVQPVAVTYEPRGDYDPTNIDDMVWHFARPCFDLAHPMRVTYLPTMAPEPGEAPRAFAQRVRGALAAELGRATTEHGHDDERLQKHARRSLKRRGAPREDLAWALPETGLVKSVLGFDCAEAKGHLDAYLDARAAAVEKPAAYFAALRADESPELRALYDRRVAAGLGPTLTFREFLAAKALAREGG